MDDVVFPYNGPYAAWRYGSSLTAMCPQSNTPTAWHWLRHLL